MLSEKHNTLIRKYDVPGPRYTSYPTVPYWDPNTFSENNWRKELAQVSDANFALYVHLPYCESLCTYCGCNTRITKNHQNERPYIDALLKEWSMYKEAMGIVPEVRELHFGGGTPTFFSPKNLKYLIERLLEENQGIPDISLEGHPNNTTEEHLNVLYRLGARRLSLGVQDFDENVQKLIHRIQPFEQVKKVAEQARDIGYSSLNFDLIYGLPGQTLETVEDTIKQTLILKPDRIAFYSYAHIPWMKPAQKSFEQYLPSGGEKRSLYELGKIMLEEVGYVEIGMDHFALAEDELAQAFKAGTLHRNFMGYTTQKTRSMIGLGASSISDLWTAFAQNEKTVDGYLDQIEGGDLPLMRGHVLSEEDLIIRQSILDLMCSFKSEFVGWQEQQKEALKLRMEEMEQDGLIQWHASGLKVLPKGVPFIRNICMALDQRMLESKPATELFSRTV
jgi:oxygen-independent coproporphyrinogen-3 oxidase